MYPPDWPLCDCGAPVLDGHLTCGRIECGTQADAANRGVIYPVFLTPSQRMALLDIITHVMTPPVQVEVFVDVLNRTETRPADLFQLVMNAPAYRLQRPRTVE